MSKFSLCWLGDTHDMLIIPELQMEQNMDSFSGFRLWLLGAAEAGLTLKHQLSLVIEAISTPMSAPRVAHT